MANTHETLTSLFTDIADSIREVSGSEDTIVADDFPTAIKAISSSSVEIELIKELTQEQYAERVEAGVSSHTYTNITPTSNYEALLIVFDHGACSSSTSYMAVAFNGETTRDATAMAVARDVNYSRATTLYAFLVNDPEKSKVYTAGCWYEGSGDGYPVTYNSDDIFNDLGEVTFFINDDYSYGYYAVYGINGIQAIANLLPQNS